MFANNNIIIIHLKSQPEAAKATDQPDTGTKPGEPDPAEVWKRDFQCQWYKAADGDVSDQQSPQDGVSVGGREEENTGDIPGSTMTSIVASTTTGASGTELTGRSSPGTGSPKPSLAAPTDGGTKQPGAPNLTALLLLLLLLLAGRLCLEP